MSGASQEGLHGCQAGGGFSLRCWFISKREDGAPNGISVPTPNAPREAKLPCGLPWSGTQCDVTVYSTSREGKPTTPPNGVLAARGCTALYFPGMKVFSGSLYFKLNLDSKEEMCLVINPQAVHAARAAAGGSGVEWFQRRGTSRRELPGGEFQAGLRAHKGRTGPGRPQPTVASGFRSAVTQRDWEAPRLQGREKDVVARGAVTLSRGRHTAVSHKH